MSKCFVTKPTNFWGALTNTRIPFHAIYSIGMNVFASNACDKYVWTCVVNVCKFQSGNEWFMKNIQNCKDTVRKY